MRLPAPGRRRDLVLALLFVLVAAVFRLPRLGVPPEEFFDEVYHAKAALQYLQGEQPVEWVHPPTAKLLIAGGVYLFGYQPWAWRLAPALAGAVLAGVFFLLARRVLATERAAVLATTLLLCDGVYLVQSRIAMTNIFAVLFQLAAALFVLRSVFGERPALRDVLLAGLFIGLALSTRWTSLWATGFLGLVVLALRRGRAFRPAELASWAVVFLVLPALIYTLSYVPWMLIKHPQAGTWERFVDMLAEQVRVWSYHAQLNATHPYFSHWTTWPWLYEPTWYYYNTDDGVRGVIALGNPALWWASVLVTLAAVIAGLCEREWRWLFCGAGFYLLYLPWGLAPRTLNFSHYLFEALPYACLSLGTVLDHYADGPARPLVWGYVALAVGLFLFFYPVLVALPIPPSIGLGSFIWFRNWY